MQPRLATMSRGRDDALHVAARLAGSRAVPVGRPSLREGAREVRVELLLRLRPELAVVALQYVLRRHTPVMLSAAMHAVRPCAATCWRPRSRHAVGQGTRGHEAGHCAGHAPAFQSEVHTHAAPCARQGAPHGARGARCPWAPAARRRGTVHGSAGGPSCSRTPTPPPPPGSAAPAPPEAAHPYHAFLRAPTTDDASRHIQSRSRWLPLHSNTALLCRGTRPAASSTGR